MVFTTLQLLGKWLKLSLLHFTIKQAAIDLFRSAVIDFKTVNNCVLTVVYA